jgi:multidrug efflux pump subunit AcrA (membrane-fusion protein)
MKAEDFCESGDWYMDDDRVVLTGSELIRWLIIAAVIIAGIGLFFYFAPSTDPAVPPSVEETSR